jgi:outer membrane protein assembly factor BamD (BamD/ComL family)
MLRQAQEDLRAGLPAQALRRLEDYDRRFAKGTLDQERQAIEAIARCQIRLDPTAQARAERFLRQSPESPLAERVRAACSKPEGTGKSPNETERGREP